MTAPTSPGVVPADVRELVERLAKQRKCQRCNCLSCGREGMGELHDHVCTGGPHCIETPEKLRNKNRNLRLLCGQAHDALRALADRFEPRQEKEEDRG